MMSDAELAAALFPTMAKAPASTPAPARDSGDEALKRDMFPTMFPAEKPGPEPSKQPKPPQDAPAALAGTPIGELQPPQGTDPADPTFAEFKTIAGKHGLDATKAAELIALHERALAARDEAWGHQFDAWEQEIRDHPTFGGERLQETRDLANVVVNEFGSPELRTLLEDPLYGSCAPLVLFLAEVGQAMRESRGWRRHR